MRPYVLAAIAWAALNGSAHAQINMVSECSGEGEPTRVIPACTELLANEALSSYNRSRAFSNRGIALAKQGDLATALHDFNSAVAADSTNPHAYSNRGGALAMQGNFDAAFADLSEAIRLDPTNLLAFGNRALVYQLRGDYPNAIADFTHALAISPGDVEVLNGRCWVRAIWGRELDQALVDCEAAVQGNPQHANALNSRAAVKFLRGDFAGAERDYDASYAVSPEMTGSLFGRGAARVRLGRREEGHADVAAASARDEDVAERYAGYGIRP